MIFDRHANLTYRYGKRKFWCTGYYVDRVRRNRMVKEGNWYEYDTCAAKEYLFKCEINSIIRGGLLKWKLYLAIL